jgi:hypothetical protein
VSADPLVQLSVPNDGVAARDARPLPPHTTGAHYTATRTVRAGQVLTTVSHGLFQQGRSRMDCETLLCLGDCRKSMWGGEAGVPQCHTVLRGQGRY